MAKMVMPHGKGVIPLLKTPLPHLDIIAIKWHKMPAEFRLLVNQRLFSLGSFPHEACKLLILKRLIGQ
jgi:hypothetical protein